MTSSWYRRSVWQFKGSREYTRSGFEAASCRFGENDLDVDCSDQHFMITGANSGIGLTTAVEIARRGGILHLVCRNAKSMKEARSHIITTTGNDRIHQHQVNFAKPKEVARWVEEFSETYDNLDVLIHNAASMVPQRVIDEDDIESNFAVNTLAVHLITTSLLPLLRKSKDPRVITVSNAGMLLIKLDPHDLNFEDMNPFSGPLSYSQTKRQQIAMNFAYAQRYEGIKFFCMHPGWVDTPGLQNSMPDIYELMKNNLRTPLQGADTIIWLAISKTALTHSSGLFFQDRTPVPTHLPLAWTRTTVAEESLLMSQLDEFYVKFCNPNPIVTNFPPDPFNELSNGVSTDQILSVQGNNLQNRFDDSIKTSEEKPPEIILRTPLTNNNDITSAHPVTNIETHSGQVKIISDLKESEQNKFEKIVDDERKETNINKTESSLSITLNTEINGLKTSIETEEDIAQNDSPLPDKEEELGLNPDPLVGENESSTTLVNVMTSFPF